MKTFKTPFDSVLRNTFRYCFRLPIFYDRALFIASLVNSKINNDDTHSVITRSKASEIPKPHLLESKCNINIPNSSLALKRGELCQKKSTAAITGTIRHLKM